MIHLRRFNLFWILLVLFGSLLETGGLGAPSPRPVVPRHHRALLESSRDGAGHFRRYVLLLLPTSRQAMSGRIDQADLVRLLSLLLEPSGFSVQSGRPLTASSFPDQVDQARKQAESISAAAVVWYRMNPGHNGSSELFLHLLDLLTDKTLVRTIRVSATGDMERAAALKLWALLRASLLEMRANRGAAALPAPVAALTNSSSEPSHGPAAGRQPNRQDKTSPRRISFSIAYGAGLFFSGKGFHHGAEISADILLQRWQRGLALVLGPNMVLPGRLDQTLDDTSVQINLLPLGLNLSLSWNHNSWIVSGGIRAGVMILSASADPPGGTQFHVTKADPTTGIGIECGWRPTSNTALVAHLSADAIWLGQCFERSGQRLCLDRMRLWTAVGFRLDL